MKIVDDWSINVLTARGLKAEVLLNILYGNDSPSPDILKISGHLQQTWHTLLFVCCSCPIDWKQGKNITVKLIKKVQKHKGRGTKRTVTKTVQNDSFFNFFSPPEGKKRY